ncbi:MAG: histidine kinase dimerization/phosphoacceptor domain -containing protein, partial [Bacteroidota bacterium]
GAYSSLENFDQAVALMKESFTIPLRPDLDYVTYANLGHLHTKQGKYSEAIHYLEKSVEVHPENADADINLYLLIYAKAKAKDTTNMTEPLARARFAVENNEFSIRDRSLMYRSIADYLAFIGNYEEALNYRDQYIEVFEEIRENYRDEVVLEMERKYATEKREQEVKVLRLEAKQKEQRSRFFLVLAIAGLCMAALIGFFLYKNREKNELLTRQNLQLEDNVNEINLLLREIHHRVKNNLQVVTSLLNIQQRSIVDEKAREAIRESKNRIQSMGLIHQSFYQNKNLGEINTQVYIQDLVGQVMASYPTKQTDIQLQIDVQEIYLDMDTLVPLGLIINELLTNALKHAFNGQETGTLAVRFDNEADNYRLEVEDDGVGVDDQTLSKSSKSFGFSLIQAFVQKLEGRLQVLRTKGTCFQIDFPA